MFALKLSCELKRKKCPRQKTRAALLLERKCSAGRKCLVRGDRIEREATSSRPLGYEASSFRQLRNSARSFTAGAQGIQLLASRNRTRGAFFNGDLQAEVSQVPGQHLYRLGNIGPEPIVRAVMSPPLKQEGHQFSVHLFIIDRHDLLPIQARASVARLAQHRRMTHCVSRTFEAGRKLQCEVRRGFVSVR